MMWGSVDGGGWWMLWGSIMMVLFWGGIIALVVWVVQSLARPSHESGAGGPGATQGETPQEIAARRYARGEITSEEYARIVNDLRQQGAGVT
ncbi:MAG: SHOCT domain-containing protein [Chloroflexota bacterium]|nr:SHOCT domain-containing protein [Chloroflexota bacterium]